MKMTRSLRAQRSQLAISVIVASLCGLIVGALISQKIDEGQRPFVVGDEDSFSQSSERSSCK